MKVAFWQYRTGHGCSTSNLMASALDIAINTKLTSVIMQSHFASNGLTHAIMGKSLKMLQSSGDFNDAGIDELIRLVSAGKCTKENAEAVTFSFINRKLNYVFGTYKENKTLFYNDLLKHQKGVFNSYNAIYDLTFIDVTAGVSELTKSILDDCDYIICSIDQDRNLLNDLFKEKILDYTKTLFVIGDYDSELTLNYKNILRTFDPLNSKNLYMIPHCVQFANAANESNIIHFFAENRLENLEKSKKKTNTNVYLFMSQVRKFSNALLELLGYGGI